MESNQNDVRDVIVSFRITRHQASHLDAVGGKLKSPRTRADLCRAVALKFANQQVPPPTKPLRLPPKRKPGVDTQALTALLGQIGKIGSNLNQLAHRANATGNLPASSVLDDLRTEIHGIKEQLSNALRPRDGANGQ